MAKKQKPLSDKEVERARASLLEAVGFGIRHTHDDFDESCDACAIDWHGRLFATIEARDQRIRELEEQVGRLQRIRELEELVDDLEQIAGEGMAR